MFTNIIKTVSTFVKKAVNFVLSFFSKEEVKETATDHAPEIYVEAFVEALKKGIEKRIDINDVRSYDEIQQQFRLSAVPVEQLLAACDTDRMLFIHQQRHKFYPVILEALKERFNETNEEFTFDRKHELKEDIFWCFVQRGDF